METTINIKKLVLVKQSKKKEEIAFKCNLNESDKRKQVVTLLRKIAVDKDLIDFDLIIPDNCEKFGLVEGNHKLGKLLYFLADMLEE